MPPTAESEAASEYLLAHYDEVVANYGEIAIIVEDGEEFYYQSIEDDDGDVFAARIPVPMPIMRQSGWFSLFDDSAMYEEWSETDFQRRVEGLAYSATFNCTDPPDCRGYQQILVDWPHP